MGKLIYLGIFLASLDPSYEEASNQARRALLETPMMKQELKELQDDAERRLFNYTGLTKDDLAYAGYAYPIFAGKISSKPFRNFKYETEAKWVIRPELEYGIYSKEYSGYLIIMKEW